jgi:hypothetical protein
MDTERKIIEDDLRLLKYKMLYRILYWAFFVVVLLFCYWLFKLEYATSNLHSQGKITEEEYVKKIIETENLFFKASVFPFLIGLFAYLRLRHMKSIAFYRKELGLDLNHNKIASGNPAPPDARA